MLILTLRLDELKMYRMVILIYKDDFGSRCWYLTMKQTQSTEIEYITHICLCNSELN